MIILENHKDYRIKAVVFDFDGTISTLRCGWEEVMEPLMIECIGNGSPDEKLSAMVREYIDKSTGIQTIMQMKWLAQQVADSGNHPELPDDPWYYKGEYNRRLMEKISARRAEADAGEKNKYLIDGASGFLKMLKDRGYTLFAASGTDEADVISEAESLGVAEYFDRIAGSKPKSEACSKEATLRELITESGYSPENILVIGDGPVEIRLGREYSALTLGIASNEILRHGINEKKVKRLTAAGAHAITDCFSDAEDILSWINGKA